MRFRFSIRRCFLSALCLFAGLQGRAQAYPQQYFRAPLDIPLNLSGNFGELRTNHFHAGLDIKTEQREGLPVYAAAEGYVSRIKVSSVGYGYALYIDHPAGYTTVYGHLLSYHGAIAAYTRSQQYASESFSVDLFPAPGELPVNKGDLIGLSGNSGGSGGPHLHFEIRDTKSENPMNPLLFGLEVRDNLPPSISGIWVVPLSDSSMVQGSGGIRTYNTNVATGKCALEKRDPIVVYGDIGFAIHTADKLDGNANRCGVYRIELHVDSLLVFAQTLDQLDFATSRAINAHTVYEKFKKERTSIHRSYRLVNNPLNIYDNLLNDGMVSFRDGKRHKVSYSVMDIRGNTSTLEFVVESAKSFSGSAPKKEIPQAVFHYEKDNALDLGDIRVFIDAFSLYEDLDFNIYRKTPGMEGAITPTYIVASPYVPVHAHYQLGIKAHDLQEADRDKALVVRWDPEKDRLYPEPTTYEDGWLLAESQYFGYFSVMIDKTAPTISSIDFSAAMKNHRSFSFRVRDNLSDVSEIIPRIDGQWALMEYDAKTDRLTYYFDSERISHGKHHFELTVRDGRGNEKTFSAPFEW